MCDGLAGHVMLMNDVKEPDVEKIQAAIAKARATRDPEGMPPMRTRQHQRAPRRSLLTAQTAGQVAEHWAALPAFAPNAAHLQRNRIVAFTSGRAATPFDVIRTRLLQQMRANNWRRLAITSPGPGCGKSMLSLNLGFSLGRSQDQRA